MDHGRVIQTITNSLKDEPSVRGLFLSGSYGTGTQDAYSDIDFVLVARQGASDEISQIWRKAIEQTGEIVLWWDRTNVPVLINAITEDWTRTDVIILRPEQMGGQTKSALKPLLDPDGLFEDLAEAAPQAGRDLPKFKYQIEEFIRILGLLHLAAGREEYINGVLGVFYLRNLLIDLMIEETGAPNRGGALHLNRLITQDQKDVLTALPPPVAKRADMITTHLAYAKTYLPKARQQAEDLGVEWPERFEAATWAKLGDTLSLERPY